MSMSLPEYVDAALPPQDGGETRPPVDSRALGVQLGSELKTAINARGLYELRWLDDLRQYKGIYPPHIAQELKDSKRSQVFYRLTTFKVNTTVARLMDLLFPQRSKNWAFSNATTRNTWPLWPIPAGARKPRQGLTTFSTGLGRSPTPRAQS